MFLFERKSRKFKNFCLKFDTETYFYIYKKKKYKRNNFVRLYEINFATLPQLLLHHRGLKATRIKIKKVI